MGSSNDRDHATDRDTTETITFKIMENIFDQIDKARKEMANTSYSPVMIDPISFRPWRSKFVN